MKPLLDNGEQFVGFEDTVAALRELHDSGILLSHNVPKTYLHLCSSSTTDVVTLLQQLNPNELSEIQMASVVDYKELTPDEARSIYFTVQHIFDLVLLRTSSGAGEPFDKLEAALCSKGHSNAWTYFV